MELELDQKQAFFLGVAAGIILLFLIFTLVPPVCGG
jgi:hypothetical protein